jgi:hypothetical protein
MHSFVDIIRALNRSALYLSGLQARFELPVRDGAGYSTAYLSFLRTVVHLRTLSITEEALRNLWHIEKKLLQLLHADSTGSPTWFLDSCGATQSPQHRLLLTNFKMAVEIHGKQVQPELNFSKTTPELFAGTEMGEDAFESGAQGPDGAWRSWRLARHLDIHAEPRQFWELFGEPSPHHFSDRQ